MTDAEAIKLCAEAMGWKHLGPVGLPYSKALPDDAYWCLSGGNDWWLDPEGHRVCGPCQGIPNPLENDDAAMALVKRFTLSVGYSHGWGCVKTDGSNLLKSGAYHFNSLNEAIVHCVAELQANGHNTTNYRQEEK